MSFLKEGRGGRRDRWKEGGREGRMESRWESKKEKEVDEGIVKGENSCNETGYKSSEKRMKEREFMSG